METGQEWLIDARGCAPALLRDVAALARLFEALIDQLRLTPLGEARWHAFPEPGGVTGFCLLTESHLAIHTFPEHGFAALNVYCCRTRPEVDFAALMRSTLRAEVTGVRKLERGAVP
jgi:S-adenosylmethionine decarboxylase